MLTRRQALAGSLAGAAALGFHQAFAQTIGKQATMIVGFAAGGSTDATARLFAEQLRAYAPTVIVENKVGAAGRIAVDYVKNAAPDGSTLLYTVDFPLTLYPHIFKKLNYDPINDLTPVAPLTKSALVLSVGPSVPDSVKTLQGFVEWCKANPGKASYATTGAGGTPHFVGVLLSNASKVPMTPVHYRGGAPALQDLLGGHVAASINPIGEALPLGQAGQIRMLAVASSQRSRFLPDVPTMREVGYDASVDTWTGIFLPAKADPKVVTALSQALEKAVQLPAMIEAQAKFANEMYFLPQPQFAQQVKADTERWGPIVKSSGYVPEE
ncbi:tripartite tricarboxylate transporter substrate-binding protein [Methylocella sp. CPCC 101449]|uniref:tripartite tricarboxylate transporter substrate-binding protein n=1 Tax=Methylocella sp. CPCC 101449 TaxID=2987531 RepID=UPI00288CB5BF|nr:tripartite tricarboxylate transporter substrate-binding protein [Methylocella sp. CPCC 101449]MDT2023826.1 tripartite tricarboxylate transporter substrate-binding protein [Methylocella sp. CPCC 101449]